MSLITLRNKIKTILQGISDIQQVLDYPAQDFQGYPGIMIRPLGNENTYETNLENYEVYKYKLYLFQIIEGVLSKEQVWNSVMELCDKIRDTFDSDEFLSGIAMPADRVMLGVFPSTSDIYEEESGKFVVADIDLQIRVSKTI